MQNQMKVLCSDIKDNILELIYSSKSIIIAIDGNCAAGKSTVARQLSAELSADVVHIDDFYLPFQMRTEERMSKPGGNIDYDRLISEVLIPLSQGVEYIYKPFCCQKGEFGDPIVITPKRITIVEGAYSCHPCLEEYYDFKIFLSIDANEQMQRIIERNGEEKAKEFKDKWIPRENFYFDVFDIKRKCNLIY